MRRDDLTDQKAWHNEFVVDNTLMRRGQTPHRLAPLVAPFIAIGCAAAIVVGAGACSQAADGGAVELSWKLRPASGPLVNNTGPVIMCRIGRAGRGSSASPTVAAIQLTWQVGSDVSTPSPHWDCSDGHGVTGFDLPAGSALLTVSPLCATGSGDLTPADPATYVAPAPIERDVVVGDIISLDAVELRAASVVVHDADLADATEKGQAALVPRSAPPSRFALSQLSITRGAMIVAGLELGLSLVWLLAGPEARVTLANWLVASPDAVFHRGHVWTLITSPLLELNFVALLLHLVVLWSFVPTLERFWGTPRFYRFVVVTSLAGTLGGSLVGLATGHDVPMFGLDPFIYASIVAFGVVYAKQPVRFFGALPLTGRQLMYGFLGFLTLYIVLERMWEAGAGMAAAMGIAVLIVANNSPLVTIRKWRLRRRRAKLTVMSGGAGRRDDKSVLN